ncbi:MAG: addiction module protein [Planctomycetes bacterium]|nr:addiction module protein [Planctomycetota bacterium]
MSNQGQELLSAALSLPEIERAVLARELIASLDGPPDADAEEAWALEIQRRLELHEKDPSRGEDWEKVKRRIEQKLWGKQIES